MTPDQLDRLRLLKVRNVRRLQKQPLEQQLRDVGLSPLPVDDERFERLLTGVKRAFRSDDLLPVDDWQHAVANFAAGRSGLTSAHLWDWEGLNPMFRLAATSLAKESARLGQVYSSGFMLIDDDDRHAVVVDLDFQEDDQRMAASLAEIELANA